MRTIGCDNGRLEFGTEPGYVFDESAQLAQPGYAHWPFGLPRTPTRDCWPVPAPACPHRMGPWSAAPAGTPNRGYARRAKVTQRDPGARVGRPPILRRVNLGYLRCALGAWVEPSGYVARGPSAHALVSRRCGRGALQSLLKRLLG